MLNIFGKKQKGKNRGQRPYDRVRAGNADVAIWRNYDKNREAYLKVSFSRVVGRGESERIFRDLYLDDLFSFPALLHQLAERLAQESLLTPLTRRRLQNLAEAFEVVTELLDRPVQNGAAQ